MSWVVVGGGGGGWVVDGTNALHGRTFTGSDKNHPVLSSFKVDDNNEGGENDNIDDDENDGIW